MGKEWSDRYKGKFDQGWVKLREEIFAKQKALGVVPPDAELTAFNAEIPRWDETPEELRPVLLREMEVYAGFLEHVDHHVGRLVDSLRDLGVLDDTLLFYVVGDNGASAEGTHRGTFNEMINFNGMEALETTAFLISKIDELGTPASYGHYATGWAHAMCTPYQWTKQVASHWGGTRNGMIVHWPSRVGANAGQMRTQFTHVVDLAQTILEAAGLPEPTVVDSIEQAPMEGVSLLYSIDDPSAPERHDMQYFEIVCNRGIYHKGWTAVTRHGIPWELQAEPKAFSEDVWELYAPGDWTQARDVASEHPDKLHDLQRLWLIEATKYNVLPLDDRTSLRLNSDMAGRPELIRGKSQRLYGGMERLSENSVLNIKNKSHAVTAELEVGPGGAEGVIIAQGGQAGGWSLYAKDGRAKYCYNFLGLKHFFAESEVPLPAGKHQVRMEFAYDGGGLAKGGQVGLFVDGRKVGEGRVDVTEPIVFSGEDTCGVGKDTGSRVSPDYAAGNAFNGKIDWVQIDLEPDDHGHLIEAGHRMKVAMARQ